MATTFGTAGNDRWTLIQGGTFTLDGLGGTDTLNMGDARFSDYTITKAADGSVHIDSVSGASSRAVLHATLINIETVVFNGPSKTIDLTTYFGDTTPPTVASSSPAAQAGAVAVDANIVFTFSETIAKGSGTITVSDAGGKLVGSYDVATSPYVTTSGSTLTLNPPADLAYGTGYTVNLSAGAVKDSAGNALAAPASLAFTTAVDTRYVGSTSNDVFAASPGVHVVSGGAGIDTLALTAAKSAFNVSHSGSSVVVAAKDGGSSYTMDSVERVKFSDVSLAFDLDGRAGQTASILGAVFGAAAVGNATYAGIGLKLLDDGTSFEALMQLALNVQLGSNPSNKAVVDLLYTNVVGVAPSAADEAAFVALLDNKTTTQVGLAVMAANTDLNHNHINLAGLVDTGLPYIPG